MRFWSDRRVIVTGGNGFLGSYVVDSLRERGCREIIIPRSSEFDLRQQEDVIRLYGEYSADIVFHLAAAVGGIGANREHPGSFFYDNLMMGVQLMEYARQFGIPKFVAIGTICAYPKFTPVPFREEDLWAGYPEETNAPYGLAKKMLLVQSEAYRQEYGYNSINLLPVNLYGPGDNFDLETSHVIPAIIRKCLEARLRGDQSIRLWGDGSPTREFLYADDAAEGILMAAEHHNSSEPVNLGSGHEISIRELAEEIRNLTDYDGKIVWNTDKPNGQPRRCLETTRARDRFGFEATTSLPEGLHHTINWYVESRRNSPSIELNAAD
ncbi:MAG: GDP-fucose synthetase [Gemmatimonadetes bacterium]|nr:GDP-fucose synthetase [Gemmatimonadota bacterium]HCK10741.1 GDP-fucose synthetase [Candidatus Latescibacterota bacterium]